MVNEDKFRTWVGLVFVFCVFFLDFFVARAVIMVIPIAFILPAIISDVRTLEREERIKSICLGVGFLAVSYAIMAYLAV